MKTPIRPSLLAVLLLAACTSTTRAPRAKPPGELDAAVARLADQLVDAAELRTSLSSLTVCVHRIEGRDPRQSYGPYAREREAQLASLGIALENELVGALSTRLHVVDPDAAGVERASIRQADLRRAAQGAGASHALVGHFVRLEDELAVAVRLVEVDTSLIVSSAKGDVPLAPLVERGGLSWVDAPEIPRHPAARSAPVGPASEPEPRPRVDEGSVRTPLSELGDPSLVAEEGTAGEAAGAPLEPEPVPLSPEAVTDAREAAAPAPSVSTQETPEAPPAVGPAAIRLGRAERPNDE